MLDQNFPGNFFRDKISKVWFGLYEGSHYFHLGSVTQIGEAVATHEDFFISMNTNSYKVRNYDISGY